MTTISRLLTSLVLLSLAGCGEPILLAPDAVLPDGSVYQGDIQDGKFHGNGTLVFKAGGYYEGEFQHGVFHGAGKLIEASGSSYQGTFVEGLMDGHFLASYAIDGSQYEGGIRDWYWQGQGQLTTENYTYQGGFADSRFEGQGKLENKDGSAYEGEFKAGRYDGQGNYTGVNGEHYQGSFKAGSYHGTGTLTLADGGVYEGQFEQGRYHGHGEYSHGGIVYKGTFVEGALTGLGSYSDDDGNRYEGEIKDWLADGDGRRTDADGNEFIGTFASGYLSGEGEMIGADGSHYQGGFEYDQYNGSGVLRNADGRVYEGEFSFGEYHGNGTLTLSTDGQQPVVQTGEWQYGKLVYDSNSGVRRHHQAELALSHHQDLLDKSLDAILPGSPDATEVYFLGVAGDGSQSVFRRELEYIKHQIETRYGNSGRSTNLINHHDSAEVYPLATTRSVAQAIQAIGDKMNTDQDVLFLYLSSHGSEDHELYLNHDSIKLPDLSAKTLAEVLRASNIKWKVIMVSACYSGGFIAELEDPHTLVMTAADAESTSFGCSEESEMTYFGKAFFREVLANKPELSLVQAFEQAKELVSQWEQEQELSASNPMISAPLAIQNKLATLAINQLLADQAKPLQSDPPPVLE